MDSANFMAYWYNLAWQVRNSTVGEDGKITGGLIERMEKLAVDYELEKTTVKSKPVADVARDIFGNIITTGKKGKEKVKTEKDKYITSTLKTQKITFSTTYQAATGTTDILSKIEEIRDMIGNSGPLVVGCEYVAKDDGRISNVPRVMGIYQMQLIKVSVSDTEMDEIGRFTKATLKFTLAETKDKKVIAVALTHPGEGTKKLLCSWIKNGLKYTEVTEEMLSAKKVNPKKNKWYELDGDRYVLTQDKKVTPGKTYYVQSVNNEAIPEQFWSALSCSPDPNAKAIVKQKKEDDKAANKKAAADLKAKVKDLQERIRAGETGL